MKIQNPQILAALGFTFTIPFVTTGYVPHFTVADPIVIAFAIWVCARGRTVGPRWAYAIPLIALVELIWSANAVATAMFGIRIWALGITGWWAVRHWDGWAFAGGFLWGMAMILITFSGVSLFQ